MADSRTSRAKEPGEPRIKQGRRVTNAWLAYKLKIGVDVVSRWRQKQEYFPDYSPSKALDFATDGLIDEIMRSEQREPVPDSPPLNGSTPKEDLKELPEKHSGDDDELSFEETMVKHAENVAIKAYNHYVKAVHGGINSQIGSAIKNWADAAKQAKIVREQVLQLQKLSGGLVDVDRALELVAMEHQAIYESFFKMGERIGRTKEERDKINEEVDKSLRQLPKIRERLRKEYEKYKETDGEE